MIRSNTDMEYRIKLVRLGEKREVDPEKITMAQRLEFARDKKERGNELFKRKVNCIEAFWISVLVLF